MLSLSVVEHEAWLASGVLLLLVISLVSFKWNEMMVIFKMDLDLCSVRMYHIEKRQADMLSHPEHFCRWGGPTFKV